MQLTLNIFPNTLPPASLAALAAVEVLASQGGVEARGVVFTRREVVDFIRDLAGYTSDKPLHEMCLLEPSFGGGDFLLPAVERLLAVGFARSGRWRVGIRCLEGCYSRHRVASRQLYGSASQ